MNRLTNYLRALDAADDESRRPPSYRRAVFGDDFFCVEVDPDGEVTAEVRYECPDLAKVVEAIYASTVQRGRPLWRETDDFWEVRYYPGSGTSRPELAGPSRLQLTGGVSRPELEQAREPIRVIAATRRQVKGRRG